MHGVVSLLDDEHYALVEHLWDEVETELGVRGLYKTPFPHFSYHVAEQYDLDLLEPSRTFPPTAFRVTVAEFNKRAQRVWEKAGFRPVQTFQRSGDGIPFVILAREA